VIRETLLIIAKRRSGQALDRIEGSPDTLRAAGLQHPGQASREPGPSLVQANPALVPARCSAAGRDAALTKLRPLGTQVTGAWPGPRASRTVRSPMPPVSGLCPGLTSPFQGSQPRTLPGLKGAAWQGILR
jgi:hypothetical protein